MANIALYSGAYKIDLLRFMSALATGRLLPLERRRMTKLIYNPTTPEIINFETGLGYE